MKCLRTFVFACAALGACCSLHSAGFIKFDGVDGESTDKNHKQWIEVASVSGVTQTREAGSGQATGRRTYEPIRFTKRIDKASPVLARAKADGKHFPKVELSIDGRVCVLTNATIVSVTTEKDSETISFNYEKIEWRQSAPPQPERSVPQQQAASPARASN